MPFDKGFARRLGGSRRSLKIRHAVNGRPDEELMVRLWGHDQTKPGHLAKRFGQPVISRRPVCVASRDTTERTKHQAPQLCPVARKVDVGLCQGDETPAGILAIRGRAAKGDGLFECDGQCIEPPLRDCSQEVVLVGKVAVCRPRRDAKVAGGLPDRKLCQLAPVGSGKRIGDKRFLEVSVVMFRARSVLSHGSLVITVYIDRKAPYVSSDYKRRPIMPSTPVNQTMPPQSHMIVTGLGRLHAVERGSGAETIVLWPSIFTDHRIYDTLVRKLGSRFRFVLIDGPAHGQSEGPREQFTMDACADAMARVMDHLGLHRAVVGGTSWGGLVAAHLALSRPDRVKALVLMNTPMEIDGQRPGLKARLITAGARWMLKTRVFRNGVADTFFTKEALKANPDYDDAFHAMLTSADPASMAAAIGSVILSGSPLKRRLPDISAPTLVIAGKADRMYPIAGQAGAALLLRAGTFVPVPGSHISAIDAPDDVSATLAEFMAREVQA